ncbi:MAG TPA: hypothetical protein VKU41_09490 [Polyangiaceae bacterium]|nr:hypothetical protein [Polyangiaceae bacterium]
MLVSGASHCAVVPFDVPHPFEVRDVEGEAAIPVDLLSPEPPPPPAPEESPPAAPDPEPKAKADLGPGPRTDAGPVDAGRGDARAPADAQTDDAGQPDAAPVEGGLRDAAGGPLDLDGALASVDGGGGPRDPEAIVGGVGAVQADVVLVMLLVNAEAIRSNVAGARMGYLLRGIPQWDEFMSGTDINPVRDTDWVIISGPSLVNTSRDVVLVHYSVPDEVVDRAIKVVSRKYDHGGPFDAGVRGVRATLAHADRAERVILRAKEHLLAVVPPTIAQKVARQLATGNVQAKIEPKVAVYLRLVNPHHPFPEIPDAITELRMRVVARPDQGADVFIEGDAKDAASATQAAGEVARVLRRHNDALTSIMTHGLLDRAEVTADGDRVKVHVLATLDHISTLMTLVGAFLGVQPPEGAGPPSTAAAPNNQR